MTANEAREFVSVKRWPHVNSFEFACPSWPWYRRLLIVVQVLLLWPIYIVLFVVWGKVVVK